MSANPPQRQCPRTTTQKRPLAHIEDRSFPCLWAHCLHTFTAPLDLDARPPPPPPLPPTNKTAFQIHLHRTHLTQQVRRVAGLNRLLADGQPGLRRLRCRFYGCHETFAAADALSCHLSTHTGKRHFQCVACGAAFVSYFGMEVWGHEGWHEALRARPGEGHARHMSALMARMGCEVVVAEREEEEEEEEEEGEEGEEGVEGEKPAETAQNGQDN